MAAKCVHKGCGKKFTDDNEECIYHPGPPIFHEGQKGWSCCKPRVLTFDEFLSIPPCTTGKHSTIDDSPAPAPKPAISDQDIVAAQPRKPVEQSATSVHLPSRQATATPTQTVQAPPESDSDDPETPIPDNATCKRRACGTSSSKLKAEPAGKCIYHPGVPIFHEGSKGWTCCKKRVLDFDEFMEIPGCKTREKHCFVGKKKSKRKEGGAEDEYEKLAMVRNDFYQTGATVHASYYLKKIDKDKSRIEFDPAGLELVLDLKTQDGKQYTATVPLFGKVDPAKSAFKILGTKLDLTLEKADGTAWPVLRSDEKHAGHVLQTGSATRA